MEKHTIQHKQLLQMLKSPNLGLFSRVKMSEYTIIRQEGKVYVLSDKNNVITVDFDIPLSSQIKVLEDMDKNNNFFCQDCINISDCQSCRNIQNSTNCIGLENCVNIHNKKVVWF